MNKRPSPFPRSSGRIPGTRVFSGSAAVIILSSATLVMLGIGTLWLPYYADRDKLRGMYEDADGGLSARERREYESYMKEMQAKREQQAPQTGTSMWSSLNSGSGKK